MNRHRILVVAAATLSAALWGPLACGDGGTEPPPPDPPRPTTVTVTPATAELTALGASVQLQAQVLDQYGQVMAGAAVSWSSSAASVAAVDGSGLVTAAANGAATITATAGSASGTAAVTVAQQVSTVEVSPAADTVVERDTVRFGAEARDANGHAVAGAEFTWASGDTSVAVVDASGLVAGRSAGEVAVTATSSGVTGRGALVVEAPVPTTVSVNPDTLAFTALGDTLHLMAEVRDQIDRVMEGEPVAWTSADTMVAAVDASGLVTAAANGAATITATAGSASGTAAVTVAQQVSTVEVSPAADTVVERDTVRFGAEARDANGHAVAGAEFTWASGDTSVAVVDASGLVAGRSAGEVAVTATSSGVTGRGALVVEAPVPTTVSVNPDTLAFTALGDTLHLMAEVRDQIDRVMEGEPVAWTSADTMVAAVDASGLVTAAANGAATITATAGSASGTAAVTVAQQVSTVEVSPAADTVVERDTVRFGAEARDANGHAVAGAEFTWASGDTSVAVVDASGLVAGRSAGEVAVTATSSGVTGRGALVVEAPVPTTVSVNPDTLAFTALGDTLHLMAEVRDQIDRVMEGEPVAWTSADTMVAAVDASGLVTAAANGAATITATAGSASGTAAVTVAQQVSTVEVSPAADTVVERDTVRFGAEARDANGHAVAGAEFTWASGDTSVAVVDASGLVAGRSAGEVAVTATSSGVTGRAQLTVVVPAPTTVAVTPDTLAFTALGQTVQLAAEVLDQAGRVMEGEPVAWTTADTMVAAVDSTGLVTAAGSGATTITATAGAASGKAVVTVMQSAGSVVVSPAAVTIALGDTVRLTAEGFDENGHLVAGTEFSWSSSDVSVAVVDASGLVRGVGEGTATITATADDALGTSEITVENPDRAALVALYEATDGPNWVNSDNWLTDAPLADWYGVDTDASGRVVRVDLAGRLDSEGEEYVPHGLTGPIPPELGSLANLMELYLQHNDLTGPISPQLGSLAKLTVLYLQDNDLDGPIPPQLGSLAHLTDLHLEFNQLSGAIPPELGSLANLRWLSLEENQLSGAIPPELGSLANLARLKLSSNRLSGVIPPQLGSLAALRWLNLSRNRLSGVIPPQFGSLTKLTSLDLRWNQLSGAIPPQLGSLASLRSLFLNRNEMTGTLPRSLLALANLKVFLFDTNDDLCAPGTTDFVVWLDRLEGPRPGYYCNESDAGVLSLLYETSAGVNWTNSTGWLTTPALEEWYGIEADALGRVSTLDLTGNGLTGPLQADLGQLAKMLRLRIGGNALSGRLPLSLTRVSLIEFSYADTGLCTPRDPAFQAWLNGISAHEGSGAVCAPLTDRDILVKVYNATGGLNWTHGENWMSEVPLANWYGVSVDQDGRVGELSLGNNNLTGQIPPELGSLANLTLLALGGNHLTGPIPARLGNLAEVTEFHLQGNALSGPIPGQLGRLSRVERMLLWGNDLTGPIPPELGNLSNAKILSFSDNELSGPIPSELGNLGSVTYLALDGNDLSGSLPPELGNLTTVEELHLDYNHLEGPVPTGFGRMASLKELGLTNNAGMEGALPTEMTGLHQLDALLAGGTDLCAPSDTGFQIWLRGVHKRRIAPCAAGDPPMAYLTQAVQSPEYPVPLVGGREALLRVFVTATRATTAGLPHVRARFFLNGAEKHVVDIPGKQTPIPMEVEEGAISLSSNADIPREIVQPGLEMSIEIDPGGTLDPGLLVTKRIPETGRLSVDVREMPLFQLTLIPFIWSVDPDSSIIDLVGNMVADPEGHELLEDTHTLLPIGDSELTAHEPVLSPSVDRSRGLGQVKAIRALEGGSGQYMGIMLETSGGVAGGWSSFSAPSAVVIAHELGHNMSLGHAPCGSVGGPDRSFPYSDGSIGVWGFDHNARVLVGPRASDVMSYCHGRYWISDYHFTNALRFRLRDADNVGPPDRGPSTQSLLLWGGVSADSVPFLEPAFVVDARPELPQSAGEHRLTGRTEGGAELFSLSFAMPVVADGDGSSSFAFVLPVRFEWEDSLASITLSGPGGSVALEADSDLSVTILRNLRTGQVRGILRDLPDPATAAMVTAGIRAEPGLEVLFSQGIPDAAAWRR